MSIYTKYGYSIRPELPLTPRPSGLRTSTAQYDYYSSANDTFRRRGYGNPGLTARRHRKFLRDNIAAAINKPVVRRLARRGGVRRIQEAIYGTTQQVVRERLQQILERAIAVCEHTKRKTLTALDVVYALKSLGNPVYGFGTIVKGEDIHSRAQYMRDRRARNLKAVREYVEQLDAEREESIRQQREDANRRADIMARAMRLGARR